MLSGQELATAAALAVSTRRCRIIATPRAALAPPGGSAARFVSILERSAECRMHRKEVGVAGRELDGLFHYLKHLLARVCANAPERIAISEQRRLTRLVEEHHVVAPVHRVEESFPVRVPLSAQPVAEAPGA
jgi:hypothetical protein